MSSKRCPYCTLLFPVDVRPALGITAYCESVTHWGEAGVDLRICAENITYLFASFVPTTVQEHEENARCHRMLKWLEEVPDYTSIP